jgi:hypothetical protein
MPPRVRSRWRADLFTVTSARHDVIEKMGYNASLVTNAHQASVALRLCRHAPRDETVGDALGP